MNIAEAKQHIIHTVRAYLKREADGSFTIPVEKQRPVLLMGPPGIGKTAIMEQIAQELQINLVAYTITHHTRQSAIGLPFIVKRNYGGKEVSVTEYTMSEIIASLYDRIEQTGVKEGILFLDEINCVSETLSPTMLQFLQYKTFGTHRVPEGFLIVAAGNPPEYNASVRDFDIVTLDRLRVMDVEASYEAWRSYALSMGVHGAVQAYLEIRKEHFYDLRVEPEGKRFVTARGWEDLSRVIRAHEALSLPVDRALVRQFLQLDEIADAFATYYELWLKYRDIYKVGEILSGKKPEDAEKEALRKAPFDEKLSLITMLTERLMQSFTGFTGDRQDAEKTDAELTHAFSFLAEVFGEGQEIVLFLQQLSAGTPSLRFLHEYGNEAYFKYNRLLLMDDRRADLQKEIRALSVEG
ncbi:MAG: AAA family ATPase [Lachnospiraceae bacterium]|nr:AAA family ATPase [Lachnospiraceae bacterium]